MVDPQSEPTAENLLKNVVDGCQESFHELHNRFAVAMFGIAVGITHDHGDAKDVVQDCFIGVWKNSGQFDPRYGKVSTWLFRITRNRAIDHLRKCKRTNAIAHGVFDDPTFLRNSGDADEKLISTEQIAEIIRCLEKLPEKQRDLLCLVYYENLSQTEISEKIKVPLGTVKTRVRSAMKRMRKMIRLPLNP